MCKWTIPQQCAELLVAQTVFWIQGLKILDFEVNSRQAFIYVMRGDTI